MNHDRYPMPERRPLSAWVTAAAFVVLIVAASIVDRLPTP